MAAIGLGQGLFAWTLAEYATHRIGFHDRRAPKWISAEHRMHHRDPLATSLPMRLLGHVAVSAAASPVYLLRRDRASLLRWLGFSAGYVVYETTHWRIHHMPSTVGEQRREHHELHHRRSRHNFGVTTSMWDSVFGTRA